MSAWRIAAILSIPIVPSRMLSQTAAFCAIRFFEIEHKENSGDNCQVAWAFAPRAGPPHSRHPARDAEPAHSEAAAGIIVPSVPDPGRPPRSAGHGNPGRGTSTRRVEELVQTMGPQRHLLETGSMPSSTHACRRVAVSVARRLLPEGLLSVRSRDLRGSTR